MDIEYTENFAVVQTHTYGPLRAYVAEIIGSHPKYGFEREFCRRDDVTQARTNTYRDYEFTVKLEEGAVYQYRGLDGTSSGGHDGFWLVINGKLGDTSRSTALEVAKSIDAQKALRDIR